MKRIKSKRENEMLMMASIAMNVVVNTPNKSDIICLLNYHDIDLEFRFTKFRFLQYSKAELALQLVVAMMTYEKTDITYTKLNGIVWLGRLFKH